MMKAIQSHKITFILYESKYKTPSKVLAGKSGDKEIVVSDNYKIVNCHSLDG